MSTMISKRNITDINIICYCLYINIIECRLILIVANVYLMLLMLEKWMQGFTSLIPVSRL